MSTRILRTAILVALTGFSTLSIAQDESPGRVGRISLSQGQVSVTGDIGDETSTGMVNWPITSSNQVTTGRDSRTEIRIGSTAIRLDADTSLDVEELDDENLRLHLHYGSASIRVRNPELLRGFEISTPQGVVRMQEPGQIRIDSGRRADQTVVSVFTGAAVIEGGGSRLTVRAGKRAEIGQDDYRTSLALRDRFDEWSMLRDARDDRSESVRYVTSEMTGYEDLDQHGSWRDSSDYGPLWSPRHVPSGWVPYRDGRWTYLQPWGWTWVDNAPWGYAPFHYGRWVMVNQRWCWAPGRNISRAIWSPALVGWVGGGGVSLTFGGGRHPAQGWYPLTPFDNYVPGYRMRHDHLRHVNRHSETYRDARHPLGEAARRAGLTVVQQSNFANRGTVVVPQAARPSGAMGALLTASANATLPPVPQHFTQRRRDGDGRRAERAERAQRGYAMPGALPVQAGIAPPQRAGRDDNDNRRGERDRPVAIAEPAPAAGIGLAAGTAAAAHALAEQQRGERERRRERDVDSERERRPRGAESFQMQQAQQAQQEQQAQQQRGFQLQQAQQRMQAEQMQRDSLQRQAAAQALQQRQQQEQFQRQAAQQQQQQQQMSPQHHQAALQVVQQARQQQEQQARAEQVREQREQREQRAATVQQPAPAAREQRETREAQPRGFESRRRGQLDSR